MQKDLQAAYQFSRDTCEKQLLQAPLKNGNGKPRRRSECELANNGCCYRDSKAAFIGLLTPRTIELLKPTHQDFPLNKTFHVQE